MNKSRNSIPYTTVNFTKSQLNILIKITNAINDNLDITEVIQDLTFIDKCEIIYIERKFEEAKKVFEDGK